MLHLKLQNGDDESVDALTRGREYTKWLTTINRPHYHSTKQ